MKCSRCGSRYPDPSCYVCGSDDDPTKPETPDHDGGSLLKTAMHPDTISTACSFICIAMGATFVATLACGGTVPALIAIGVVFAFALFVGLTQPS